MPPPRVGLRVGPPPASGGPPEDEAGVRWLREGAARHRLRCCRVCHAGVAAGQSRSGRRRGRAAGHALPRCGRRPGPQPRLGSVGVCDQGEAPVPDQVPGRC
eukprot:14916189-Alexandrium_andersonii.AAC.1